jgi:hypothetical protein
VGLMGRALDKRGSMVESLGRSKFSNLGNAVHFAVLQLDTHLLPHALQGDNGDHLG